MPPMEKPAKINTIYIQQFIAAYHEVELSSTLHCLTSSACLVSESNSTLHSLTGAYIPIKHELMMVGQSIDSCAWHGSMSYS